MVSVRRSSSRLNGSTDFARKLPPGEVRMGGAPPARVGLGFPFYWSRQNASAIAARLKPKICRGPKSVATCRLFAQCGDPVLQRPQADPQHLGGAFAIAAHVLQGEFDVSLLEFHEWLPELERCSTLRAG